MLEDGVEDHARERDPLRLAGTRARRPADRRPATGRSKTSIVFWGLPDSPGALVDVLQEFAGRGMNLSKIESRPRKQGLGRYVFFADLEGAQTEPAIADALAAVRRSVETLRVLGCYPAASQPAVNARRPSGAGYTFGERSGSRDRKSSRAGDARRGPRRRVRGKRWPHPAHEGEASQPEGPARPARAGGPRRADSGRVLVLNASYEPLNVCTVRRAVVLVLKEKAELVEQATAQLRSESVTLPHPVVIRLVTYVRVPRDKRRRRITRRAVFARDSWTCQYCGTGHRT